MAKNDLQDLRRSTVVSTFGPGSVVDFRADNAAVSGMAAGLEEWDRSFPPAGLANPQTVRETRLQKKLGVQGFRLPPVVEERRKDEDPDTRRLVAVRFPQWLQCPECDLIGPMKSWSDDPGKAYRYCPDCTAKSPGGRKVFAIPVRFVMACPRGHVDEFPWHWWVGHKPECSNEKGTLTLRAEHAGLAGLVLKCPKCKASKSMDGIFAKQTWERFSRCSGKRPWLSEADEACKEQLVAVQRGASNLYFAVTQSALSIPPWSDRLQECLGTFWETLVNIDPVQREAFIEMMAKGELGPVLEEFKMTPAQLAAAIDRRVEKYAEIDISDLRPAEFRQFVEDPGDRLDKDLEFEIRREAVPEMIQPWISTIARAVRLREVRAITGFTRINPPGDPDSPEVAHLSRTRLPWLPAIEVRGEGIFLALNERRLSEWETHPLVQQRAAECHTLYRDDWRSRHGDDAEPPRIISPRYLLCHTFAHALMRQLTLECGYSSASLQERIYAADGDDTMAGVLIYTATPDSDGTLGGLQRQGKAARIPGILTRALSAIEWCSSDPLCISDMMGAQATFSHSACHACVLAPETSCEVFNSFLDRGLVTGVPGSPENGLLCRSDETLLMAILWPRELPLSIRQDRRRRAEVRVYDKLADVLEDSFTVFYSSPWLGTDHLGAEKDGECDFLIAHSRLGFLAIEVKGGGISYDPETGQWWSTDAQQFRHKIKDPVNQARSAKHELLKKLRESGRWSERFIHISHGVIFPDASTPPRDLGADRPANIFCCSREFSDHLRRWVGQRFDEDGNPSTREPLGGDGLAAFTHILAAPFQLHLTVAAAMDDAAEHMGVLEPAQFHILDHIADVTRAEVRGGAGTGKTVIAGEEARRQALSGKRTLLTCYSSPLAAVLSRRLDGVENLTVASFHSVCGQVAARAGVAVAEASNDQELFDELLPAALLDALVIRPDLRWEAIVVDEGQDFLPNWWLALSEALVPQGKLRVLSDSNQRVYASGGVPGTDLELTPIRLKRNLRNTRAIHGAAHAHYDGPEIEAQGPDGHPVNWIEAEGTEKLIAAAYAELRRLIHQEEVAPSDIAILCPTSAWFEPIRNAAARSGLDFASCDHLESEIVILDTVRRFKGLERPAVILVAGASDMTGPELAYVGLSRPRTYLAVVACATDRAWLKPE